jgi:hypothetical protein
MPRREQHGPVTGTVALWLGEEGWGAVASPAVEGEVWTLLADIVADGYRELREGEAVTFVYETPGQDGYPHRAVWVETANTTEATREEFARERAKRKSFASRDLPELGEGLRGFIGPHGLLLKAPPGVELASMDRLHELGPDVVIRRWKPSRAERSRSVAT